MKDNPYQPPKHSGGAEPPLQGGSKGIGGWLLLPILGLLLSIYAGGQSVLELMIPSISFSGWRLITNPSYPQSALAGGEYPIALLEASAVIALAFFSIVLLAMMFTHRRALPKMMISYYILGVVLAGADLWQEYNFYYTGGG